MNKRQEYIELELSGEKLDGIVAELRDKLLDEFWSHVPEGADRDQIRLRIENNIMASFKYGKDDVQAT